MRIPGMTADLASRDAGSGIGKFNPVGLCEISQFLGLSLGRKFHPGFCGAAQSL